MKIPHILLACLLLTSSGCMTMVTVDAARGSTYKDQKGAVVVDEQTKPGYYALVPLTVAGDIATSPFQLLIALMMAISGIKC